MEKTQTSEERKDPQEQLQPKITIQDYRTQYSDEIWKQGTTAKKFRYDLITKNPDIFTNNYPSEKKADKSEVKNDVQGANDDYDEEIPPANANTRDLLSEELRISNHEVRAVCAKQLDCIKRANEIVSAYKEIKMWPLKSIRKTWKKCIHDGDISSNEKVRIISCVSIGQSSVSAARLINSYAKQDAFYDESAFIGSQEPCKLSLGAIDCFPQTPLEDEDFQELQIMLMLHGDGLKFRSQFEFLRMISDVLIICTDSAKSFQELGFSEETKGTEPYVILVFNNVVETVWKNVEKCFDGAPIQMPRADCNHQVSNSISNMIQKQISESKDKGSLQDRVTKFFKFEQLGTGFTLDLQDDIIEVTGTMAYQLLEMRCSLRDDTFPLSADKTWGKFVKVQKKFARLKNPKAEDLIERDEAQKEIRKQQYNITIDEQSCKVAQQMALDLSQLNRKMRIFYIKWVNILLSENQPKELIELNQQYAQVVEDLNLAKSNEKQKAKKDEAEQIQSKIAAISFGIEHFYREIYQFYDMIRSKGLPEEKLLTTNFKKIRATILKMPEVFAYLLIDGQHVELMDGDNSYIIVEFIKNIFSQLESILGEDKKVALTGILGTQSSGKSTFLNCMYNFDFATAQARCTKGIHMSLVPISDSCMEQGQAKFSYQMILDTEGLGSNEIKENVEQGLVHDNEMATIVIGMSDITVINQFRLNDDKIQSVLEVMIWSFAKLKARLKQTPRIINCYQGIDPNSNPEKDNAQAKSRQQDLNNKAAVQASETFNLKKMRLKTSDNSAESEFCEYKDLIQEIKCSYISPLFNGNNPSRAAYSSAYTKDVQKARQVTIKNMISVQTFSEVSDKITEIFEKVLCEDFDFQFQNNAQIKAYQTMLKQQNKMLQDISSQIAEKHLNWKRMYASQILDQEAFEDTYQTDLTLLKTKFKDQLEEFVEINANQSPYFRTYKETFRTANDQKITRDLLSLKEDFKKFKAAEAAESKINQKIENFEINLLREISNFRKANKISGQPDDKQIQQLFEDFFSKIMKNCEEEFKNQNYNFITVYDAVKVLLLQEFPNEQDHVSQLIQNYGWPKSESYDGLLILENCFVQVKKFKEDMYRQQYLEKQKSTFLSIIFVSQADHDKQCEEDMSKTILDLNKWKQELDQEVQVQLEKTIYSRKSLEQVIHRVGSEPRGDIPSFAQVYHTAYFLGKIVDHFYQIQLKENEERKAVNIFKRKKVEYQNIFIKGFKTLNEIDTQAMLLVEALRQQMQQQYDENVHLRVNKAIIEKHLANINSKKKMTKIIMHSILKKQNFGRLERFSYNFRSVVYTEIKNMFYEEDTQAAFDNLNQEEKCKLENLYAHFANKIPNETDVNFECENIDQWLDACIDSAKSSSTIILDKRLLILHLNLDEVGNRQALSQFKDHFLKWAKESKILAKSASQSEINKGIDLLMQVAAGCQEKCPFCFNSCDQTYGHNAKENVKHSCTHHKPQAIIGWHYQYTTTLVNRNCTECVGSENEYVDMFGQYKYKNYQSRFPDWEIIGSGRANCEFWDWAIIRFERNFLGLHRMNEFDTKVKKNVEQAEKDAYEWTEWALK